MENLNKIKDLIEKISIDTAKVYDKGNKSASIRARKNASKIMKLIPKLREEILIEIKKHEQEEQKNNEQ